MSVKCNKNKLINNSIYFTYFAVVFPTSLVFLTFLPPRALTRTICTFDLFRSFCDLAVKRKMAVSHCSHIPDLISNPFKTLLHTAFFFFFLCECFFPLYRLKNNTQHARCSACRTNTVFHAWSNHSYVVDCALRCL